MLRLLGKLKELSDELGITDWHVSLAHDGGQAIAYVIAERANARSQSGVRL